MRRQIVLDTETTGLDFNQGHRIIEVGCIELIDRKITGNNLHFYINPERATEDDAFKVHGISDEFLLDKPKFNEIAYELKEFLVGAELIAHNATFDVGFLDFEFVRAGISLNIAKNFPVIDTLALAREIHPGQRNNLDALLKRYQVVHVKRDLHGALLDAEILAHVYLKMTGGQINFLFEQGDNQLEHAQIINSENKKFNLSIVTASDDELLEHNKFLKILGTDF